ncbi:unnamed protein product [Prunus armeniaca]
MPPPHSGVALSEKINALITEWEIEKKFSITLDNASANTSFVEILTNQLNFRGLIDSNFSSCPSPQEWIKVEKISKFLGYFDDVTCLFSGTKYPTSNIFFPKVFIIQHQIKAAMEDNDGFMNKMGTNMNMKFEKYWSEYKFKYVRDTLTSLFDVYSENLSHLVTSNNGINETASHTEDGDTIFEDFDNSYKNGPSTSRKNELHKYLDEKRLDRKQDIDVLSWWQMEHFHYPILSNLVRDVLTIPISTIASESVFSIGGRVLDQYRSSLLPEIVQALLCTRDWLFGKGALEEESATVESLTEDIFKLICQDNRLGQSSNSISLED